MTMTTAANAPVNNNDKNLRLLLSRTRGPPDPKPILDRRLLSEALASSSPPVSLKDTHLDLFYQLLHQQGYPDLPDFARRCIGGTNTDDDAVTGRTYADDDGRDIVRSPQRPPTKNAVSSRKHPAQLPKPFLQFLLDPSNGFATVTSSIESSPTSADRSTTKLAVRLADGHVVECVLMRHGGGGDEGGGSVSVVTGRRVTVCVSSQVGCAMGCTFCATGTMGIRGNLTSGEILEQLVHAGRVLASESSSSSNEEGAAVGEGGRGEEGGGVSTNGGIGSRADVAADETTKRKPNARRRRKKREKRTDLVRNVVFMGMGEPLNNYKSVVDACRALIDRKRWNLSYNRVTVSTVGVTPRMRDLTRDLPEVNLALSLHAPNQAMRTAIVPAARAYPIEGLIDALDAHMMALSGGTSRARGRNGAVGGATSSAEEEKKRDGDDVGPHDDDQYGTEERRKASKKRRAMIEYVMLEGDTSSLECAHQLGRLCENRHLVVNLIPYNQTNVQDKLSCPSEERIEEFRKIVSSYGAFCSIRRTMGADIAGACGQLVVEQERKRRGELGRSTEADIEDGPFQTTAGGGSGRVGSQPSSAPRSHRPKDATGSGPSGGTSNTKYRPRSSPSHTDDSSEDYDNGLDRLIRPLAIATSIAACCFVISSILYVLQRRKR